MLSKNLNSFLRPLKNKGFKEEIVTKIGLYDIVKSTTLESNKSHLSLPVLQCSAFGLQALQDIEPCQRPTGLLDQPTIAQIA
jgi:hypothetical protein